MPVRSILRSFGHRNFRLFFTGQGLSLIGTQIQVAALPWFVLLRYPQNSGTSLGWVSFAGQFPAVFVTPLAGVVADRVNKRRLLLVTQTLAMLQALALAILVFADWIEMWHILLLNTTLSLINAFDITARQAMLNEIVDSREDLGNAIALNSSIFNVTRLVGPSLAMWTFVALGAGGCFTLNSASFLAVILALAAMQLNSGPRLSRHKSTWAGMRDGMRYAAASKPIRSVLALATIVCFLAVPYNTLVPLLAKAVFHAEEGLYACFLSASGLGALTGALFLASRHSVLGLARFLWVLPLIAGLAMLSLAHTTSIPIALALLFAVGLTVVVTLTTSNTVLQTITTDGMRGRVLSLYALTFLGMAPLGSVLAGWLADKIGIETTLQYGGIALAASAIAFGVTLGHRLHGRVMKSIIEETPANELNIEAKHSAHSPLPPRPESMLLKSAS